MAHLNRHRIQRQVVELSLGEGFPMHATQDVFARAFQEELLPELNAVFDRIADATQLLRLDRLEIDLGTIASSDWRPELRRRLGVELAEKLSVYRPESRAAREASAEPGTAEPLRQFLYFLRQGRLPWWGEREAAQWGANLSDQMLGSPALRALLLAEGDARWRLIDAIDDARLGSIVARWSGVPQAAELRALLEPANAVAQASRRWRRCFWRQVMDAVLENVLPARGVELLRTLLLARANPHADSPSAPARTERSDAPDAAAPGGLRIELLPAPWSEWLSEAQRAETPSQPASDVRAKAADDRVIHLASARAKSRETRGPLKQDEEAIYLPGAGVVLLHPFLETLFRDRGLLAGQAFLDEEARERAVHLLGLLTFGRDEVAEYDLVTAKLLCGFALERPVAPALLDDDDKRACDELLGAVLKHWTALRSSSRDWLRAQFFLRDGKLERVDEGFRLTVERRAQDVLISRLPWGLGVIGFPWLKEKIFVHCLD